MINLHLQSRHVWKVKYFNIFRKQVLQRNFDIKDPSYIHNMMELDDNSLHFSYVKLSMNFFIGEMQNYRRKSFDIRFNAPCEIYFNKDIHTYIRIQLQCKTSHDIKSNPQKRERKTISSEAFYEIRNLWASSNVNTLNLPFFR